MGLQARYHPREDRMLVTLRADDERDLSFWVTRRQWLGWLRQLEVLYPATAESVEAGPPAPAPHPAPPPAAREAVPLDSIRLRRVAQGVNIVFAAGEQGAGWLVPDAGIERLRQVIVQQADRAGWDAEAGLERLQAQAAAGELLRKAGAA